LNIVQVTYDPYQLEDMMQSLVRDEIAWCSPFDQGKERLIADQGLRKRIIKRELAHRIDPKDRDHPMRLAVSFAAAQIPKREDNKLRIVKRGAGKIDLLVSLSMGAKRCIDLDIG